MEQSPAEETAIGHMAPPSDRLGTIVGEGLASAQLCSTSSTTMVQAPPPGVLSFRDQTISTRTTLDTDQEQPPKSKSPLLIKREPFKILEDLDEPAQNPVCDVPMSPEGTLKPDWLSIGSPEVPPESDLDAFLSPCRPKCGDVPMTPEPPLCIAVPMSPATAPHSDGGRCLDVSMNSPTPARTAGPPLVPDPWDNELISHLLSALTPPLPSHPHYITWSCNIPTISPRMTITMGTTAPAVKSFLSVSNLIFFFCYRKSISKSRLHPWRRSLRHRVSGHQPCDLREDGVEGMRGRSHVCIQLQQRPTISIFVPCPGRSRNRPIPGSFTSTPSWTLGCSPTHVTSSATFVQLTCSITAAFCLLSSTITAPCWLVSADTSH